MGGVINIITKRGEGPPKTSVTLEGGSYGTLHTRMSVSGGTKDVSYAFGLDALHVDGFPRYGYRIGRPILLSDGVTPLPPLPWGDPTNKGGVNGLISYRLSDSASLDFGFAAFDNFIRFDNPFAFAPGNVFNARNHSHAGIAQGYVRLNADTFDGRLHNKLTLFGFLMDRTISQTEGCFDPVTFFSFDCRSGFRGTRRGAEYQGDLKLGAFGLLTFGLRTETETAKTSQDPAPAGTFTPISAQQTTNSVYAQDKIAFGDRLDVTIGGRVDAVEGGKTFATWRSTASYRIEETGTRLHASAGTGAKIPSLFQRFSSFGFAGLSPEQSFGMDAGVTQKLFDDRVTLDATFFDNEYRNLINFSAAGSCTPLQLASAGGCYYNVGRARTYGTELSGEAILVPEAWKARATYTFMLSRDLIAGGPLLQRPRHQASASLIYTGLPHFEAEGRVTFVGVRRDFFFPSGVTLAPYAKLDFLASYKVNDTLTVFGRVENITNARYEEVFNYGVAGRAYYGGIKTTW
jgi:vitamin B12 transporter